MDCISEQDLDEMNIEIIRNTLYKAYLEAFYTFCKELGGTTADVMCEILAVSKIVFFFIFKLKFTSRIHVASLWRSWYVIEVR